MVNLPRCEGGKGDGCEAMAEGSEFVRQLQQRSAEKYEERRKQALIGYNYRNFKDFFAFKLSFCVVFGLGVACMGWMDVSHQADDDRVLIKQHTNLIQYRAKFS